GVGEQIVFRVGSIDDAGIEPATASADFVCANLTADVIITLLPSLVGAACGRLVMSGILDSQIDSIVEQLQEMGNAGNLVMLQDGEWVALVV
ncbi:MAG TPA: 50S ribosomal protein L11 methyltransferase, partial [Pyrinomonadaceae bacterium]|nr:50S ribosomal protein L11 methyltransferase [Pyrinomonadaceae bacterium]